MTYTIHWETRCRAANPRVNPRDEDVNLVWCSGFSAIIANTRDQAVTYFKLAFPYDYIVDIT